MIEVLMPLNRKFTKNYVIYDSNLDLWYKTDNLSYFCKKYSLNESCLRDVSLGRQSQHRGFYCKEEKFKELIQDDLNIVKSRDLFKRFRKIKKPFSKKIRYRQSSGWIDFQNNVEKYYQEWHIGKNMPCSEIARTLEAPEDGIRLKFHEFNLPIVKSNKNLPKGDKHHAYLKLSDDRKKFLKNLKEEMHDLNIKKNLSLSAIGDKVGLSPTTIINYCKTQNIDYKSGNISLPHQIIIDYLRSNQIEFIVNDRKILRPKEVDIFIPSINLAIEVNGVFWHTEQKIGRSYHLDKLNLAKDNQIRLIQFWDEEIMKKKEIVFSILNSIINKNLSVIHGRKCLIKKISSRDAKEFLEKNHIQGNRYASHNYCAFYNDEPVACMTFSKNKKYGFELIRFCNKINTKVVGIASRLMKFFELEIDPEMIVTFSDKRLFEGNLYLNLGFKRDNDTPMNYHYFTDRLESRLKYQKHKLESILENFDKSLSEYQNMLLNGIDRIWDCGHMKFIKVR